MAFILSTKEILQPLYTIRRMIVSGNWETERLLPAIEATSKLVSNLQKRQLYYYSLNLKLKPTNFIPRSVLIAIFDNL
jgi:hypothetical protein